MHCIIALPASDAQPFASRDFPTMSTPHPFIPGLVREVYIAGSRHSANTPQLIRSEVNDDTSVDFEWQAEGSSIYRVTAKGMLTGSSIDAFKVVCSCPD